LDERRYVEFAVSTARASGKRFSFDERRSGTGPSTFEIRYSTSTDGTTFTPLPDTGTSIPNNTRFRTHSFDFSETSALDNQASLALRIYGYGATGTTGTWRFDNVTFSAATAAPPVDEEPEVCEADYTAIADIWRGDATGNVTLQGVVTADFRTGLRGFFVQDIAGEGFQGSPVVSDGIFAFTPSGAGATATFEPGNLIRFDARVSPFQGAQQVGFVENIVLCDESVSVTPVALELPLEPSERLAYVGMLTTLPQRLTVTENFLLGRFGMMTVAEGGRLYHPNNGNVSGAPEAIRTSNVRRSLVIDDGSTAQNPDITPFLPPFSEQPDSTIRVGDTMTAGVTGVFSLSRPSTFDASGSIDYRLHVIDTTAPVFSPTNPRPPRPQDVGGNVKVASFNVLNYFTTFEPRSYARSARNDFEFERQRTKLIEAIKRIDADVVGLIEMENNGDGPGSAIHDLARGLNAAYGEDAYAVVPDPGFTGNDAIKQALIYKPAKVTLLAAQSDDSPVHNRPPVAGTFRQNEAPFGAFSAVVVHHKSKRCSTGFESDPETQFEGCFNRLRTQQSLALRDFVADLKERRGDADVLLMGDFNAYNNEDPIQVLVDSGLVNLNLEVENAERYSYVFDGESGTLDYALASASFAEQVSGVTVWHINPDEPRLLEYNSAPSFGGEDRYTPTPYRSSDHDPIVVGLELSIDIRQLLGFIANDVRALCQAGALNHGQCTSLSSKLDNARRSLDRGNNRAAANGLNAFANEVQAFLRAGRLTPEQGQPLIAMARAVAGELR
ncbi:MAG: ExeM/NucH family extracellular endonuclease, partial [Deinococcota bacterium]|nr:ExeM/NucH family extracellular endonuclease [Deinococcota bacterium]